MAEVQGKAPLSWLREGWGGVNQSGPTEEEAAVEQRATLEQYETARLFHEVLTTGRGPELLEHLRGQLFERPVYVLPGAIGFEELTMPIAPSEWSWIRAGQNSVLHHFLAMIDMARRGPPKTETQEQGNDG